MNARVQVVDVVVPVLDEESTLQRNVELVVRLVARVIISRGTAAY